jgi:DNA-binding NtrC family response regulator
VSQRILVIDDDAHLRSMVRHMLELDGYEVEDAADGDQGLRRCREMTPAMVITDLFMPGREGLETIMALRREAHDVPVVAISGGGSRGGIDQLATAGRLGAVATLSKPFSRAALLAVVHQALDVAARADTVVGAP